MINPYKNLSINRLHTLATSLGHTITVLGKECEHPQITPEVRSYKGLCVRDAQQELLLINEAMESKG